MTISPTTVILLLLAAVASGVILGAERESELLHERVCRERAEREGNGE